LRVNMAFCVPKPLSYREEALVIERIVREAQEEDPFQGDLD
jgi:hypothetical protein